MYAPDSFGVTELVPFALCWTKKTKLGKKKSDRLFLKKRRKACRMIDGSILEGENNVLDR